VSFGGLENRFSGLRLGVAFLDSVGNDNQCGCREKKSAKTDAIKKDKKAKKQTAEPIARCSCLPNNAMCFFRCFFAQLMKNGFFLTIKNTYHQWDTSDFFYGTQNGQHGAHRE
jgi:hypothetical protein